MSTTLTLQPDETSGVDNYITNETDQSANNYGTDTAIDAILASTGPRRILLKFDLSSIEQGSIVQSAVLTLTSRTTYSGAQVSVHRLTRAWNETESSWNKATSEINWTAGGGDFASQAAATYTPSTVQNGIEHNIDITSLVQEWVSGTANYGMLVKCSSESGQSVGLPCHSSGASTVGYRPKLVITHQAIVYGISGIAKFSDNEIATLVRAWRRDTGAWVGDATPNGSTGAYSIITPNTPVDRTIFKTGYRPLTHGPITPVQQ
ncbi:MAG: DNRLRE domain-containing protein [Candidatus Competibacter sp.]|nr:DNRLRE domain-containing protein [Candidatus Competibacter sp.]